MGHRLERLVKFLNRGIQCGDIDLCDLAPSFSECRLNFAVHGRLCIVQGFGVLQGIQCVERPLPERLGVSADPFLMAIAVAASCAFLTPIGHQNNALVMGPGGYRFGDYWRMGLPLEIVILAVSVPSILWVWPL